MTLRILSGNRALQIMLFRKLGGKCHFFLRFCTRKRSETYINYAKFCLDICTCHLWSCSCQQSSYINFFRREKSIDAFRAEISCMSRLRNEIIHLRALTSSQQEVIDTLTSENDRLRKEKHLIGRYNCKSIESQETCVHRNVLVPVN